jgi:signal transduction histidine kinase
LIVRLLVLLLLAGATVLGVLQVQWVNAAAREEEIRLRATVAMDASHIRRDAEDEVWVLASLVSLRASELAAGDWKSMEQRVRFWRTSTRFPELMLGASIVTDPVSGTGLLYSPGEGRFLEAPLQSELLEVVRNVIAARDPAVLRAQAARAEESGYLVIPVYRDTVTAAAAGPGEWVEALGAVAVRIDAQVLYTKVVPDLVERHLQGFPYRISRRGSEAPLAESGSIPAGERPEVTVNLSALSLGLPDWLFGRAMDARVKPPEDGAGNGDISDDPSLRYWLYRTRTVKAAAPAEATGTTGDRLAPAMLEVYYPRGSIGDSIRLRRVLNLVTSGGILALLVLSAFVLYRMYRRSVRLRTSEQEFVASISHELRTPITVIQATSENLRRGLVTDPGRVTRYASVIGEQVRRLAAMVEGILFYSGLQSGMQRLPAVAEMDLEALVNEVVLSLREVAAGKGKSIEVRTRDLPASVCSDRTALRLLIENLLMNAIHHADPGPVRIIAAGAGSGTVAITIEDDGPGIPLREQARIFEPFTRGARSLREQKPGSGLGLHLVRRVAGMLGGGVRLDSPYVAEDGRRVTGCRFVVSVPLTERCRDG